MRRLVLSLVVVAGCVTPSIPIPPPDPEAMEFALDTDVGEATFSYPPNANYADAIVYVYNRDEEMGVIVRARVDGSVGPTPPFPALIGDRIAVTIEAEVQVVSTCVTLREGGVTDTCF
jgi:hypothetical protein